MELESTKSLGSYPRSRHLPEDLLHEILRRLPVKSLLRFRCVSKPWLALVDDDADFARSHLDTFKNNRDQSRLFVVEQMQRNFPASVRCADTFEPIWQIPSSLYFTDRREFNGWIIVSSLDGLVLLESSGLLKLWNPSLRHSFLVPPLPPSCTATKHSLVGLGYDPMAKDYKIVTVSQFAAFPSVGIFTIGANSWEIIQCSEQHFLHSLRGSVCLQGRLYFIAMYKCQHPVSLWSFDLRTKVFSRISTPYDTDEVCTNDLKLILVDGGSSVAMFDCYGNNSLWVLDMVTMNWRRVLLSGNLEDPRLLYGKMNGDMLIVRLLMVRYDIEINVGLYRHEKNEYKINARWFLHISTYVESLILNKLNRAPHMQQKKSIEKN